MPTTENPPPPESNIPPSISGVAPAAVEVGEVYSFVPNASDADGDPLTFSINDAPGWATFDNSTGALEGTPQPADVGVYDNIVISVDDDVAVAVLPAFSISVEPQSPSPAPFGLDSRPVNNSCQAVPPPSVSGLELRHVFADLRLANLTVLTQPPNDADTWYFATRDGQIGAFDNDAAVSTSTSVLDLTGKVAVVGDGGLIQLLFHPDYPDDRRIFVNYSTTTTAGNAIADVVLSSFVVADNGLSIDPQSEAEILRFARSAFHQGGFMAFDAEGLLYVGFGDGTDQGDPNGIAQDMSDMRGKIHRIDVNGIAPYEIPDDNPFAGAGGVPLETIFASGLRNPYRGDIDPVNGDIFVADIGWNRHEEVNRITSGDNLGWSLKEATRCLATQAECDDPDLVDPLIEYHHRDGGCSVIGGYFYRGQALPQLAGRFIFSDFCSSKISAVEFDEFGQPFEMSLIPPGSGIGNIHSFAKDSDGELYVLSGSQIYALQPERSSGNNGPATQLSQTGCFDPLDARKPAAGLLAYELNSELWSDGASKRRWLALPDNDVIDIDSDGDFLFPIGTVLAKEFSVDGEPIETRLFMKDDNGAWHGYSYEWLGGDAFRLDARKDKVLSNGQTWHFPDGGECLRCHTEDANFALGPEISQLNLLKEYEQTNRVSNQLATLEHIGMLSAGLTAAPNQLPALAGLSDDHQPNSRRARSYLHSNCAGCHRGAGITQSSMDLRFGTARDDMNVCGTNPELGNLGVAGAKLLDPGQPGNSILYLRPSSIDPEVRMPPLATTVVHDAGMTVLRDWISSAAVCAVESDSDQDQVADDEDNCPDTPNADQADLDRNQVGDACEST